MSVRFLVPIMSAPVVTYSLVVFAFQGEPGHLITKMILLMIRQRLSFQSYMALETSQCGLLIQQSLGRQQEAP